MFWRTCSTAALMLGLISGQTQAQTPKASPVELTVDAATKGTPFPHVWEQMFGSGRAVLSLREGYRKDLRTVKQATDFRYVRFHAIFHDEVGLFDLDAAGKPVYNFSYVDQIYDGLLENGIKPFVELSFMPKKLSADPKALHSFWYKQNTAQPKDYATWDAMIQAFTQHLVERYGIDEVSQWYFEVWNEPNLDFWTGEPRLQTYLELYDHTARAVKAVDKRLRVGGPATARTGWVSEFLEHVKDKNVPADFVSTHVYGDDKPADIFGTTLTADQQHVDQEHMVCKAVARVHDQVVVSPLPKMPLILSEFNATWDTYHEITDTSYMGPWLASTISQCDGLTAMMSYWSFSDVFEEQGVVKKPFYGGYGLVAEDNIPKPALNAFAMLHQLGETRLPLESNSALATRRKDGTVVVALWNYAAPTKTAVTGAEKVFVVNVTGTHAHIMRLDAAHGDVNRTYEAMGSPAFPTRDQIAALRKAGLPAPAEDVDYENGELTVTVPPQGLAVIEIK